MVNYANKEDVVKMMEMRDPTAEEIETPEFNAVWDCIKGWDISEDELWSVGMVRTRAEGPHVVAILDALREAGCLKSSR